jgi:predicted permease
MLADLHFALRSIAKERWFSASAIVVLALGIGVNATGFALVNGVLLRERSGRDSDHVYVLSWRGPARAAGFSLPDLADWRIESQSFAFVAGVMDQRLNVSDDRGLPALIFGARVVGDAFLVFAQQPVLGRIFTADDERQGAAPVVIIGRRLWRERYHEDPGVLGTTLRVNGIPATIVGVMPEGFRFPGNAELWTPLIPTTEEAARSNRFMNAFARLKPGVSRRMAEAEADSLARRVIDANRDETKEFDRVVIESVPERFLPGAARTMFLALMTAVSFVLLIACANVANLLLSRSAHRAREVALRMMLGATRLRVVRLLLIESVLLATAGGVFGLLLAYGGVRLFDAAVLDSTRPYWIVFAIDARTFLYVAGVCVLTAIIAGLVPALQMSKDNSYELVKEHARGSVGRTRAQRFSGAMVVAQLALTIVLLAGAGLMVRSFQNLQSVDIGYDTRNVLLMRLLLPAAKYSALDARTAFYDQLESRLGAVAGVDAATVTTAVPPNLNETRRVEIEGRTTTDVPPAVAMVKIGPRFFHVVDRALLGGRGFQSSDALPGSESVIVNERFARMFLPDENPLGRRMRFVQRQSDGTITPGAWRTIIGVSPTLRHSAPEQMIPNPVVYVPYAFEAPIGAWVMVRTPLPAGAMFNEFRRAVQSIDPDQPIYNTQTVDELLRERRWTYSAFGGAFAIFGIIALALSSAGLYGVVAYSVSQRTQEIGVRVAVGARSVHVLWLFLGRGLRQVAAGIALGLAGALGLSGALRSVLVDVTPGDPLTFTGATCVLAAVALTACLLPVWGATRLDPLAALRQE